MEANPRENVNAVILKDVEDMQSDLTKEDGGKVAEKGANHISKSYKGKD